MAGKFNNPDAWTVEVKKKPEPQKQTSKIFSVSGKNVVFTEEKYPGQYQTAEEWSRQKSNSAKSTSYQNPASWADKYDKLQKDYSSGNSSWMDFQKELDNLLLGYSKGNGFRDFLDDQGISSFVDAHQKLLNLKGAYNEDSYNQYVTQRKDYESKRTADLSQLEQELKELERQFEEGKAASDQYQSLYDGSFWFDRNKNPEETEALRMKGSDYLREEIAKKRDFLEQARAIQEQEQWAGTYGGKSYQELQNLLGELSPTDKEFQWVNSYAESVMTPEDYSDQILKNTAELKYLEEGLQQIKGLTDQINMGGETEKNKAELAALIQKYGDAGSLEGKIEELEAENWNYQNALKYGFLSENEDYKTESIRIADVEKGGFGSGWGLGKGDPVYHYINNIDGARDVHPAMRGKTPYAIYDNMTDGEIADYNYLYNTQGREAAKGYLDYIMYDLEHRQMEGLKETTDEIATEHPITASAMSVASNMGSILGVLDVAGQNLMRSFTGEYEPIHYERGSMAPTAMTNTIRGTVSQNIADATGVIDLDEDDHPILSRVLNGKSLGDVYQLGMSMADSGVTAAMAMVGIPVGTVLLGGSAASQGVLDALERGASDTQALSMGILNGVFEMLFEEVSLDKLVNGSSGKLIKDLLVQGGVEGSEEFFTTLANTVADVLVMADKSQLNTDIQKYMQDGASEKEATIKALENVAIGMGWDFIGGLASGVGMAGMAHPVHNYIDAQTGKKYASSTNELVQEALELNPNSDLAKKLNAKLEAGDKVSNLDLYRLVQENEQAMTSSDRQAIEDGAKKRLAELGETGNVDMVAQAISKQVAGEKLSKAQSTALSGSRYGHRVLNELNPENIAGEGYSSDWARNLNTNRINSEAYNPKEVPSPKARFDIAKTAQSAPGGENAAPDNGKKGIRNLEGKKIDAAVSEDGVARVISTGEEANIKGIKSIKDGRITFEMADGSEVDGSDISFASADEAILYDAVASLGVHPEQAKVLISGFATSRDVPANVYAKGMEEAFLYGKWGAPQNQMERGPFASRLTALQRQDAYEMGRMTADMQTKAEQARKEGGRGQKKEPGKVHFEGDRTKLTKSQQTNLKALDVIAEALGVQIHVFESKVGENGKRIGANGRYDTATGDIYIDLYAGADGKGTMLFTAAHELTHMIRQESPAKFRELSSFLFEQYGKNGVDIQQLVEHQFEKARKAGKELSYDGAFEEVVADSMESMLTDGKVIQELKKRDEGLWQKVKDYVLELCEKIRKAYRRLKPDSVEGRIVAEMRDAAEEMRRLFTEGLMDAAENGKGAEKNTTREGDVKYSFKGYDSETGKGIYEGNFPKGTPKSAKAERILTYIQNVWSKNPINLVIHNADGTERIIQAKFDPTYDTKDGFQSDASKLMGGNRHGTSSEQRVTLDLADDYYQIASEAVYNYSKQEIGKDSVTHQGVKNWHYFINDILFQEYGEKEMNPYRVTINVKEKSDGNFVYSFSAERQEKKLSTQRTLHAAVTSATKSESNAQLSNSSIRNSDENVKQKFSLRDAGVEGMTAQEKEANANAVLKYFGKTYSWKETGYLTAKGYKVDFSGRHEGGPGGYRTVDHRDVSDALGDDYGGDSYSGSMVRFMAEGNIRISPESGGINLSVQPTKAQLDALSDFISKQRGEVILDIDEPGGDTVVSVEYPRGTYSSKVINDIRNYFETGEKPYVSEVSRFRYSLRDTDVQKVNAALEKQNEKLREDVSSLKELLRLQKSVTGGKLYKDSSLTAAAKYLMENAGAKGDVKEFKGLLREAYDYIATGEDITWDGIMERSEEAARWLEEHGEQKTQRDPYADEVLREIKGGSFHLDEQQKQEAAYRYGSMNDYRKGLFGRLNVSDSAGMSLDEWWAEKSQLYPDIFDPEVPSSDMPSALMDALDSLKGMNISDQMYDRAGLHQDLLQQIYDGYWRLSTLYTVADVKQNQINLLKGKHYARMTEVRAEHQKAIRKLKAEHRADMKELRSELNRKAEDRVNAVKKEYNETKDALKAARKDVVTLENEFVRAVKAYEKQADSDSKTYEAEISRLMKAYEKQANMDSKTYEKEFARLMREYEKAGRKADNLEAELERRREAAKEKVDSRKKTVLRNEIKDMGEKFHKMLTAPGKGATQHVPVRLASTLSQFCDLFAESQERGAQAQLDALDERSLAANGKLKKGDLNSKAALLRHEQEIIDRKNARIVEAQKRLKAMREAYADLKDSSNAVMYDQHTADLLNELAGELDGKDIQSMTRQELEMVKKTMQGMMHAIVNANKAFVDGKEVVLTDTVRKLGKDMSHVAVNHNKVSDALREFFIKQMTPDVFFDYIGGFVKDGAGKILQRMLVEGETKMLGVQRDFYNQFKPLTESENKQTRKEVFQLMKNPMKQMVDVGMKDRAGNSVKFTRGMMMQLYMLLNQEDSLESISRGGLKLPKANEYYKGDMDKAYSGADIETLYSSEGTDLFELNQQKKELESDLKAEGLEESVRAELEERMGEVEKKMASLAAGEKARLIAMRDAIWDKMTETERKCIEAAQAWYAYSGKLMADVFESMYGYRPTLVDLYVPIHRDMNSVKMDMRVTNGEINLEDSGFTKERVKSYAPILMTDFFSELNGQQNAISRYYGFAEAQRNFNRMWNMQIPGTSYTVKGMVAAKFGDGKGFLRTSGTAYVENYIADIAGGNKQENVLSSFYGRAASATLSLNPRVAFSQLASIPTAAAEIGWKNMAVGFAKGLRTSISTERKNELAQKSVYFFQRYRGEGGITEIADLKAHGGIWDKVSSSKVGKFFFNWCQAFDVFATASMWSMAEEQVKGSGMKPNSEGYQAAVERVYEDIIRKTQPNYTVTERSDLLRDKRGGMKLVTMYKTQSNQNLNILMGASLEFNKMKRDLRDGKNGVTKADVKRAEKRLINSATAVVIGGQVFFVGLRTAINFLTRAVNGYRDDDTDEVTAEETLKAMGREMLSSMAGMFALGSEVYNLMEKIVLQEKYYGITDSAMGLISDNAEKFANLMSTLGDEDADTAKKLNSGWNLMKSTMTTFGIPVTNAEKLVQAAQGWARDISSGDPFAYSRDKTTDNQYRARFLNAYRKGDMEKCADVVAYLVSEIDEPNDRRTEEKLQSGFQNFLKTQFLDEKVTEEEVKEVLVDYLEMDASTVDSALNKWKGELETGKTESQMEDGYLRKEISEEEYKAYLQKYSGKTKEQAASAEKKLRCERDEGIPVH